MKKEETKKVEVKKTTAALKKLNIAKGAEKEKLEEISSVNCLTCSGN